MSPTERAEHSPDQSSVSMSGAAMSDSYEREDGPPTGVDTGSPEGQASALEFARAAWQVATLRTRIKVLGAVLTLAGSIFGLGYATSQPPKEDRRGNFSSKSLSTTGSLDERGDGDTGGDEVKLDAGLSNVPKAAEEDGDEVVIIEENSYQEDFLSLMEQISFFDEKELTNIMGKLNTENIKGNPEESLDTINDLVNKIQVIKGLITSLDVNELKIHPLSMNEPVRMLNKAIAFLGKSERDLKKIRIRKMKDEKQKKAFLEAKANLTKLKDSLRDVRALLIINLSDNELEEHSNDANITAEMDNLLGQFESVCFTSDVANDKLAIKRIQGTLVDLGYGLPGSVTGVMDDETRAAIKRFQASRGINVSKKLRGKWKGETVIAAMEICG